MRIVKNCKGIYRIQFENGAFYSEISFFSYLVPKEFSSYKKAKEKLVELLLEESADIWDPVEEEKENPPE